MKHRKTKGIAADKNLFKAMNYELAGEIGAIDNEDMINNRKLASKGSNRQSKNKK